jgi:hypothetical protein
MTDNSLVALYEIKRQTFLLGFIQHPEKCNPALAYAYEHRVAPLLHDAIAQEVYGFDPFDEIYAVKRDFLNEVFKYLDERCLAKDYEAVAFYSLENKFGGYKTNRGKLIHLLEYLRIAERFDDDFWTAVEANAPAEASPLAKTFTPEDVWFGV